MDFKPHKSYTKPLAQIEKKMSEKETEVEKNEEIEKNIENVQSIFNSFNENLSSVKIYFSKFGNLASGEDENIKESSDTFFKEVFADMKKNKERVVNPDTQEEEELIDKEYFKNLVKRFSKRPKLTPRNYEILSRSSFLMLNNYFEYLLTDLLSYYYNKFKDSLS